jgi:hypothetical protein
MGGALGQFLLDVGSTIAAALVLAVANGVRRMSHSVRDTAAAVERLDTRVTDLEDIAHWPLMSPQHPSSRNGR